MPNEACRERASSAVLIERREDAAHDEGDGGLCRLRVAVE